MSFDFPITIRKQTVLLSKPTLIVFAMVQNQPTQNNSVKNTYVFFSYINKSCNKNRQNENDKILHYLGIYHINSSFGPRYKPTLDSRWIRGKN